MDYKKKTKEQLIAELKELREQNIEFGAEETESKNSRYNKQLLEFLFESDTDYISISDLNGVITYVNRVMEGLSYDQVIGANIQDFLSTEESKKLAKENLMHVITTGETAEFKTEAIVDDVGTIRIFTSKLSPLRDSKGEINGCMYRSTDITERKKAEESLRESLKTSADLMYSIPFGIFIYQYEKPDRLILLSGNPEAERLTGINVDEWIGKENNEIWPEARKVGVTDSYLKVIETGETYETEDLYYKDEKLEGAFRICAFRLP